MIVKHLTALIKQYLLLCCHSYFGCMCLRVYSFRVGDSQVWSLFIFSTQTLHSAQFLSKIQRFHEIEKDTFSLNKALEDSVFVVMMLATQHQSFGRKSKILLFSILILWNFIILIRNAFFSIIYRVTHPPPTPSLRENFSSAENPVVLGRQADGGQHGDAVSEKEPRSLHIEIF